MQTRRGFISTALTLAATAAIAPKALAAPHTQFVPTEVFDHEKWAFVPLEGGLRNIKKGQIFRRVADGMVIPTSSVNVEDGDTAWFGIAESDGETITVANGSIEGVCYATYYETEQAFVEAGFLTRKDIGLLRAV